MYTETDMDIERTFFQWRSSSRWLALTRSPNCYTKHAFTHCL